MRPWKLLSLLLDYPDAELVAAREELEAAAAGLRGVAAFVAWLTSTPLADAQEAYVRTFDFDRRASLHLTFHTHGDKRQRGLELVRLKRRYAEAGLPLEGGELPDYLPVMLEFAALAPDGQGEALLAEARGPLELVRSALHAKGSPYACLLDAVCAELPKLTAGQLAQVRRLVAEGPPTELVGLEPFSPPEVMPVLDGTSR